MWKLTTGILADNMYDYLERERYGRVGKVGKGEDRRGAARQGVELRTSS